MSRESTTPNLVELVRELGEAANRRDFDAMLGFFAPDAVWEGTLESTFRARLSQRQRGQRLDLGSEVELTHLRHQVTF